MEPEAQADAAPPAPRRARPKPGERRMAILQTLARMLQQPGGERVTTAALARELQVSEAALYRHFASKAQMFEALIDFIEESVFGMVNWAQTHEAGASAQARRVVLGVLQFAEKNPGLARVMSGDALVGEHERLQARVNHLHDKLEGALRQCLRDGADDSPDAAQASLDIRVRASALIAFVIGRVQRQVKTGFARPPGEWAEDVLARMLPPR